MTFVSTTTQQFEVGQGMTSAGPPWVEDIGTPRAEVSVPVTSGDVLVAVVQALVARRTSASPGGLSWTELLEIPQGWQRQEGWHWTALGSHDPNVHNGSAWVAWHRATSTGTWSGRFEFLGGIDRDPSASERTRVRPAYVHVLRFSGMVSVRGLVGRQSSNWTMPAVPNVGTMPSSGHALRIAGMNRYGGFPTPFGPAGHTERVPRMMFGNLQIPARPDASAKARPLEGGFGIWEAPLSNAAPGAVSASGTRWDGFQVSVFVASAAPPSEPTIIMPAAGMVDDFTKPFSIRWEPALPQDRVRVTRQMVDSGGSPTGSLEYLTNLDGSSWSTSATTLTTEETSVAVPAGVFSTAGGQRYRITVATTTPGSTTLGDAASVTIRSFLPPTATSVTSSNMSGGKIVDRRPWITGAGTPGAGATLEACDVEVVDHATGALITAGTHGTGGWWYPVPPETPLPNGSTVRLRARVRQTGGQWSEWIENGPFEVDAPRPPAPTITSVTATTHPTSGLPGNQVTITSSVAGDVTLYRDGRVVGTWTVEADTPLVAGDFAAGSIEEYTAAVTAPMPTGNYQEIVYIPDDSLHSTPVQSALDDDDAHCWLVDALHPEDAVRAHCLDFTVEHPHPSTVYHPLSTGQPGPVVPIVQSLAPSAPSGTLTVLTETHAEEAAVVRMLTSGRPLVYTRWSEALHGHPQTTAPLPPLRFIAVDTVTPTHITHGHLQMRSITVAWVAQ